MRAVICAIRRREVEFHFDVDWMKQARVRGVVIGRRILFAEPVANLSPEIFKHELEHAYQVMREGTWRFYLKYFYYSLRYGYHNNPFEIEAFAQQRKPLTKSEETLLCQLKEGSTP
jgi:hypothetical protein